MWAVIRASFVSSVVIQSHDRSFPKVRNYIMQLPRHGLGVDNDMMVETKKQSWSWNDWREEMSGTAVKKIPPMQYTSSTSSAITVMHKGTRIWIYLLRDGQPQVTGRDRQLQQAYKIHMSVMGQPGLEVRVCSVRGSALCVCVCVWGGGALCVWVLLFGRFISYTDIVTCNHPYRWSC